MRSVAVGLFVVLALVACGGSSNPPTAVPTSAAIPSQLAPSPGSLPTPTGGGFCGDREYALNAADLVRAGELPWEQVAAYIATARHVIQADAASALSSRGAHKIRQLALTLRTLELSVRGSVENYPDDYSSQTWVDAIPGVVAKVSRENDCPP